MEAFGGSLPNIVKKVASNSSLGSETKSKSTADTIATDRKAKLPEEQLQQQEEEKLRGDDERRLAEETNRLQQLELEQCQKQLQLQAAALVVDMSLLPFLTDQ